MCKRHKLPVRDTIIIHVVIFSVLENYFVPCVFYFLLYFDYFNVSLIAENNSYKYITYVCYLCTCTQIYIVQTQQIIKFHGFHRLYIQTTFGIGQHPLILTSNSKHTQTTTLELETISFPSLIWNYQSNLILDSIMCIQTERKRNSMQMLLCRDWHQLPKPYMRAPCSFNVM
jgi:hypothetical protein